MLGSVRPTAGECAGCGRASYINYSTLPGLLLSLLIQHVAVRALLVHTAQCSYWSQEIKQLKFSCRACFSLEMVDWNSLFSGLTHVDLCSRSET